MDNTPNNGTGKAVTANETKSLRDQLRHMSRHDLRDVGLAKIGQGFKVASNRLGATKASPVRDPATGQVDVLATAAKYELWEEPSTQAEKDAGRWLAGDLAAVQLRTAGLV